MSHYAKVENGIVTQVIVAEQDFINTLPNKDWVQTSYNTYGNVHYGSDRKPDGGIALRKNYATVGSIYDALRDAFYTPSPFPSWLLNETTYLWEPPIPYPEDGKDYLWNEEKQEWVLGQSTL